MKLWMIFSAEQSPFQKPMVFLSESDAREVYDRIQNEMIYEQSTLFELDTEDEFQNYILSGGKNWYVSYELGTDYYNAEPCLIEERPLTEYDGEWSMTVRAESAVEAIHVLKNKLKEQIH